jgi:hypothetical protein
MSQQQAERAKQQLYEDSTAREELTDDEAAVLLKWAEGRIDSLAAQEMDDTAFDEAYGQLRQVILNVNRFTGKRTYAAPEELKRYLDQMAMAAGGLGAQVSMEQLAMPQMQGVDDNIALIERLTAMLTPGSPAQTAEAQASGAPTDPQQPATPQLPRAEGSTMMEKLMAMVKPPSPAQPADKAASEAAPPDVSESAESTPPGDESR